MSNASEYADSIRAMIMAWDEAGTPFGVVSDDNPVEDRENGEEVSAMDYLSDALDIQYIVNREHSYRGAHICIAFGGPTAWINTMTQRLEVTWWSAPEVRPLPAAFCDALDDALKELWEMGA